MIQFGNLKIQDGINNKERAKHISKYNEYGLYKLMTRISYGILNVYTTKMQAKTVQKEVNRVTIFYCFGFIGEMINLRVFSQLKEVCML